MLDLINLELSNEEEKPLVLCKIAIELPSRELQTQKTSPSLLKLVLSRQIGKGASINYIRFFGRRVGL